jgi:hypothetical protein
VFPCELDAGAGPRPGAPCPIDPRSNGPPSSPSPRVPRRPPADGEGRGFERDHERHHPGGGGRGRPGHVPGRNGRPVRDGLRPNPRPPAETPAPSGREGPLATQAGGHGGRFHRGARGRGALRGRGGRRRPHASRVGNGTGPAASFTEQRRSGSEGRRPDGRRGRQRDQGRRARGYAWGSTEARRGRGHGARADPSAAGPAADLRQAGRRRSGRGAVGGHEGG